MRTSVVALIAALAVAGTAPRAADGQVHGVVRKVIPADWSPFLRRTFSELPDGTSLQKLVAQSDEVADYASDAARRVVGKADNAALKGRKAMDEVIAAIDPAKGDAVHGSIDDLVSSLTIQANQMKAARQLNGGEVPAGFHVIDGSKELLEAVARRSEAQKAAGGGHMWKRTDGFYMSIAENKRAAEVLAAIRKGDKSSLSTAELRELRDAMTASADQATNYQRALKRALGNAEQNPTAKAADDAAPLADNAVSKPKNTADNAAARAAAGEALARVRLSYRRADFEAVTGAGEMVMGTAMRREAFKSADDMYAAIAKDLASAPDGRRMSPAADKVLDALQTKSADIAEARRLHNGRLPPHVKQLTEAEEQLKKQLEEFFNGSPKPMKDGAGWFYSRADMKMYEEVLETLRKGPDEMRRVFASGRHNKFIQEHLRFYDTELERSLRRAFKYAQDKLPKERLTTTVTHSVGDGRMHGTGGYSTLINYPDSYTTQTVRFDAEWLDRVLESSPVYRELDNPRMWGELPAAKWPPAGGFAAMNAQQTAQYTAMEATLRALKEGKELTPAQLAQVRKSISTPAPTDLADVAIANAARAREDVMLAASKPQQLASGAWPARVATKTDAQLEKEAAEAAARRAELEKAAGTVKGGKTLASLAEVVQKANADAKTAAYRVANAGADGKQISWPTFNPYAGKPYDYLTGEALKSVRSALDKYKRVRLSGSVKTLLDALETKKKAIADALKLNMGKLPDDMSALTIKEEQLLDELHKFFSKNPVVDGYAYKLPDSL